MSRIALRSIKKKKKTLKFNIKGKVSIGVHTENTEQLSLKKGWNQEHFLVCVTRVMTSLRSREAQKKRKPSHSPVWLGFGAITSSRLQNKTNKRDKMEGKPHFVLLKHLKAFLYIWYLDAPRKRSSKSVVIIEGIDILFF